MNNKEADQTARMRRLICTLVFAYEKQNKQKKQKKKKQVFDVAHLVLWMGCETCSVPVNSQNFYHSELQLRYHVAVHLHRIGSVGRKR